MEDLLFRKLFLSPLNKNFAEITLWEEFLYYAEMAWIVNKIVSNFDNKWVRVLSH